jgi:hypothetical protein
MALHGIGQIGDCAPIQLPVVYATATAASGSVASSADQAIVAVVLVANRRVGAGYAGRGSRPAFDGVEHRFRVPEVRRVGRDLRGEDDTVGRHRS